MALSSSLLLFSLLLVPPLAIMLHKLVYSGWVPPSDYGSGEMFNLIADRYDFVNRVMSLGMDTQWRERMVKTVHKSLNTMNDVPSPRILDVSTGTADVALLLAKEIPQATILGIDPSTKMLDLGREKVHEQKLDQRIVLETHDARDLAALDEIPAFDAATMAFGIRNVPEKEQALCEIHRLLKNKSRFCILEFATPDESSGVLGMIARVFIRHVVPFLGGILSGQSREYLHLQNSIQDFPPPAQFVDFIKSVTCPTGSYQVDELIQMNGDSVQLYVSTVVRDQEEATTIPEQAEKEDPDEPE